MSLGARVRARLTRHHKVARSEALTASFAELARSGPAPLRKQGPPAMGPLSIAIVVPSFRRGSGGHTTIVRLAQAMSGLGHGVSLWLEDSEGWHSDDHESLTRKRFESFFDAGGLSFHCGFAQWAGADAVLATGWQTVPRVQLLHGAGARAYLVQDHEPDFYPASAERLWAEGTYRSGLHCIAASPWLANLLRDTYDAKVSHFDLALDHDVYGPGSGERNQQLVIFYARSSTPRRAVPLGLMALELLARRRPDIELATYGDERRQPLSFECKQLGVLSGGELSDLYSGAGVGMVLSLTNPSLVCLEMMACGLPCVELASDSMLKTFPTDGPLRLAEPAPDALATAIEGLLDDGPARETASLRGISLARTRTWQTAGEQVLAGLLSARER